jgi:tryptophan 2,3-dioxygenase
VSDENRRVVEEGVTRDLRGRQTYAGYLELDRLLSAQHPLSDPEHHDELLFIIQHQTSELWMKLIIHELDAVLAFLADDQLGPAQKALARVKQIQRQLFEQWGVLATLTPSEYVKFRGVLGPASGFQSLQYRIIEFQLGNKNREMLSVFAHDAAAHDRLRDVLESPSLYDEFLRLLARRGYAVPVDCVERDWSLPHRRRHDLLPVFKAIYEAPERQWETYELCEELVDVEESFQLWRFRHMKTVERIIGHKRGTGGSSGVSFLRKALDLTFFPELLEVRTVIGAPAVPPGGEKDA